MTNRILPALVFGAGLALAGAAPGGPAFAQDQPATAPQTTPQASSPASPLASPPTKAAAASPGQAADAVQPEPGSAPVAGQKRAPVSAKSQMVVAANPLAARAGYAILDKGGNAIDAMVTTQLILNLVEPQSSGIGGGAFLVYYDAGEGRLTTFDGRETAPATATPKLFLDAAGDPLTFYDAVVGGRSVGTPGTLKLIYETHEKYGKLDWKTVVQPAIDLATQGFEVSPRLNDLVSGDVERLRRYPGTRGYFFGQDGKPLPVGHLLKNPDFAETLRTIADKGADGFYEGRIAEDIVDTVQKAEGNPGKLALADLAAYDVIERQPVCAEYRTYDVCGMGPPSSGALTIGQILELLEPFDIAALGPKSAKAWRLIGDASRLAFADRGRYMADIDYVPMPLAGLLDGGYLLDRSQLLNGKTALSKDAVQPGMPPWDHAMLQGDDKAIELPSTSHFSIADKDGNVVSITTTIENEFGSRLMVDGFLLNNELTDFSFETQEDGRPIANRVEPGKRPRSSMAPTIVMKDNRPVIAIGSPGGSQIIGYVAQALVALIDWKMNIQDAVGPAASSQPLRPDGDREGHRCRGARRAAEGHGLRGKDHRHELRAARHLDRHRRQPDGRRRPAARGHRGRRLRGLAVKAERPADNAMKAHFSALAAYNHWANRRLYRAVAVLVEADRRRDVGLFFHSLHATLNHILLADRIWLGRLTGKDRESGPMDRILHEDFGDLTAARFTEDLRLTDFVDAIVKGDLDRPVTYRNTAGTSFDMSLSDILAHLFNHQTHHRGQAHTGLSIVTGGEPDSLDLLQFHRGIEAPDVDAVASTAAS